MKLEIYKSGIGRWSSYKWRLKADNGKILASGRGFNNKRNLKNSLSLFAQPGANGSFTLKNSGNLKQLGLI